MGASEIPLGAIKTFDWETIPDGWKFELLGNVARIRRGASPRPAGDPRYFGGTIPWFKIGDATRSFGRYLSATEEFVNEDGAKRSVRVPAGSLLISNSGVSLGFAVITKVEGCIHDGWLLVEKLHDLDQDYLYYVVNLLTQRIRRMADGTTQPNLNTDIARRLLVPLPPLSEQRAIAHILGVLDDKIELNRRMNETLEAMARAIFKSWFVNFDPVRAKAGGRQPLGIDAETAALFSDTFQDSPLGKIPSGWKVSPIGDVVRAVGGSTPSTDEQTFWNGDVSFCTPKDMASLQSPILLNTERRISQSGLQEISSGLLSQGTVLLSSRAPIGYLAVTEIPVAVNQGIIALICDGELPNLYRIRRGDVIVTFNYDTVIEESISNDGPHWDPSDGYGFNASGVTLDWARRWRNTHNKVASRGSEFRLLKLHGSINWTLYKTNAVRLKPRPYVVRARNGAPVFDKCSVLPPGWHKRIDINPYRQLWRKARLKLEMCSRLAIIGYSLPETDLLARALLAEVCRLRAARRHYLEHLHLADPSESVKDRFSALLAPALGPRGHIYRYSNIEELSRKWETRDP